MLNFFSRCIECDRILPSKIELRNHMQRHKDIAAGQTKKFQCDICPFKKFRSQTGLKEHIERHKNDPRDSKIYEQFIADNFDMKCDRCDVIFTVVQEAPRHYKEIHNKTRGYVKCCGMKLRTVPDVRQHIDSHLRPETFKCDECNKNYSSRHSYLQHLQRHKGFICDYCGKTF